MPETVSMAHACSPPLNSVVNPVSTVSFPAAGLWHQLVRIVASFHSGHDTCSLVSCTRAPSLRPGWVITENLRAHGIE